MNYLDTEENNKYRQGRRQTSQEYSYVAAFIAGIGILVLLGIYFIAHLTN